MRLVRRCAIGFLASVSPLLCPASPTYRGVSYAGWSQNAYSTAGSDQSIGSMKADGVDTVALNVCWFQDNENSSTITPDFNRYSVSDASVQHAIQAIHARGMKVILKPMVDLRNGNWRGQINPSSAWFSNYTGFMNHWADFATVNGVEGLSVGCEYNGTQGSTSQWRSVVGSIRSRYSGSLTYSANWDSYKNVGWWDALDSVGVDAYFPISSQANPTQEALTAAWSVQANDMEAWQSAHAANKKIVFTEIGYRSATGATTHPWDYQASDPVNLEEQRRAYVATLGTLWNKSWWGGAFWWNWETDPNAGGLLDNGYTPQGKPAEAVMRSYYAPVPEPSSWVALSLGCAFGVRRTRRRRP